MHDLRLALRTLFKSPGFTAVAVLTLALGIGLNTAMFSLVNPMLFRPLPFKDPRRLVYVDEVNPAQGFQYPYTMSVSYADYVDWRARNRVFEDIGIHGGESWTLSGLGSPERLQGARISATLFSFLGIRPVLGRNFLAGEDQPGAASVTVLSHRLWQRRFGGETNVLGRALLLSGRSYTVVGVMPAGFRFPEFADLWTPLIVESPESTRGNHSYAAVARLKPEATLADARADLARISDQLTREHPRENTGVTAFLLPLRDHLVRETTQMCWILLGAVGFVLAVACANIANLFLARALARERDYAIRAALGASRWHLMQPLLAESLFLSVLGGVAGLLFSQWGVKVAVAAIPVDIPYWITFEIDPRVLAFTAAVCVLSCLLFGLLPAWHATGGTPQASLKTGRSGGGEGRPRVRLRGVLVAGEVTLALLLLSGTGLMIRTFLNLQRADPGFDPEGLLKFHLTLWQDRYREGGAQAAYFRQVVDRLSRLPSVRHAAAILNPPLSGSSWGRGFTVEGQPPPSAGANPVGNFRVVTPCYFATMGIPLLAGRDFSEADTADRSRVLIIDTALARTFFANEDPLGKRLKLGLADSPEPWREIVGVVGDVKHYGLDQPVRPGFYLPYQQAPNRFMSVVLRTTGPDPLAVVSAVRHELAQIDGEVVLADIRSVAESISRTYWHKRFFSQVLTVFTLIALALAAVGVAAVVGYTVAQRAHEIGVRLALGAQRRQVVQLVVLRAMLPVGLGMVAGLVASGALMRVLSGQLYGVSPLDPGTFLGSAFLLGVMGFVACYFPARRATRIDPMAALRAE